MRELYLMADESTERFFVLRDSDGVSFQIARSEFAPVFGPSEEQVLIDEASTPTGSTIRHLTVAPETGEPDSEGQAPDGPNAEGVPESHSPSEPAPQAEASEHPAASDAAASDASASADAENDGDTPEYSALSKQRGLPEPDPLLTNPLTMPPREIQARIRAGATAADLAEEMGVAESRIEPYSHPVVLERMQIAEAAKQSHPVRDDGPAKLTLFEILATAFAARGHSLSEATWDATRDPGDAWVVHLRWRTGLTDNEALWTLRRSMGSPASTEARNTVAADLTDPDFVQPVRSLTAVDPRGGRGDADEWDDALDGPQDASQQEAAADGDGATHATDATTTKDAVTEGDFLRHPDGEQPQKRRRKAVTPHWEDVLLGVRTNTKRPRK